MPTSTKTKNYSVRTTCRLCESANLGTAFSLVSIPEGDRYVSPERKEETTDLYPHDIMFCRDCGNLQTGIDVNVASIYDDYLWTTSISPGLVSSYAEYVDELVKTHFNDAPKGLAVEFGSNDGTFLKFLSQKGFRVVAVEPAKNLATRTASEGITTINDFFGPNVARQIREEHGLPELIVGNHVFPNANDVAPMAAAAKELLAPNGVMCIQVFYLYDVLKNDLLENFNHEHLSYFYVRTIQKFFARHGLELFDVKLVPTKGGSVRCFIQHKGGPRAVSPIVAELIAKEEAAGLHQIETYRSVAQQISEVRQKFQDFIAKAESEGKRIAAYGTSIGATVFTYQYGLGEAIDFFVDDDPVRHGKVTPGYHIPVKSPESIYTEKPDFVIAMAPLYADIIIGKHQEFLKRGGHFVKFRPKFEII